MDATRFVADAAYRRAVFEAGAGAPEDRPLVAQFAGDDPAAILAAARFIEDRVDVVIWRRARAEAGLACAVGVKLRVLETAAATVALARRLEAAGADLLTVHGRTRAMKKPFGGGGVADLAARVEAAAGAADLDAAAPSWYRRYRSSDGDIAAFLAAHGGGSPGGACAASSRATSAPQLPELEAHWAGRRYRNAAKRAAKDAGRAVT
ncbi:tRNA dihydrouridine synthase [Aureococcus anophagefferens]|nr:tRNA dihydrouridine synthase [Aureococcus anophagefferens]